MSDSDALARATALVGEEEFERQALALGDERWGHPPGTRGEDPNYVRAARCNNLHLARIDTARRLLGE